jgi:uncharacterized membrane protein
VTEPATPHAGAALSYGWSRFKESWQPLVAIVALPAIVEIVFSIVSPFALRASIVVWALIQVASVVVSAVASLGIYRSALMITAGEPVDFGRAFQYDRWGEWIVFSFVFGVMVVVGLIACVIPGLLVLAFFGLAPYYFIDQRMSLGDALSASRAATRDKDLGFPVLLSIVVGVLGAIACLVGLVVTLPVSYIALAFLYRSAQGQPVASA